MQTVMTATPKPMPAVDPARPLRALILDDSLFDRMRIKRLSKAAGMALEIDEAISIAAMLDQMDTHHYDLILIDFRLPEGDGLQALKRARFHSAHLDCPVIMIAGVEDLDVAIEAVRSGASTYVTKGRLSPDSFKEAVETALGSSPKALTVESTPELESAGSALTDAIHAVQNLRLQSRDLSGDLMLELARIERLCLRSLSNLGQTTHS